MKLWLVKLYSKFRKTSIYYTTKDNDTYYIQPNGSVIKLLKTEEGSTIRGNVLNILTILIIVVILVKKNWIVF